MALAHFVGKQRALHAKQEGIAGSAANKRAGGFRRREDRLHDQREHGRDLVDVHGEHIQARNQVQHEHDGTSRPATAPMRLMPPMITMPTRIASTMPVRMVGTSK